MAKTTGKQIMTGAEESYVHWGGRALHTVLSSEVASFWLPMTSGAEQDLETSALDRSKTTMYLIHSFLLREVTPTKPELIPETFNLGKERVTGNTAAVSKCPRDTQSLSQKPHRLLEREAAYNL